MLVNDGIDSLVENLFQSFYDSVVEQERSERAWRELNASRRELSSASGLVCRLSTGNESQNMDEIRSILLVVISWR